MKTRLFWSSRLKTAAGLAVAAAFLQPTIGAAETAKTVVIVGNDTLKFSVTRIEASPHQSIHIQLRNEGSVPKDTMGHNWILLDGDDAVMPYATAAIAAHDTGFMPKTMAAHVLAFIPLIGPKEVGEVTFNAPDKPGKYPFICSSAGHSMAGMRGELIVK